MAHSSSLLAWAGQFEGWAESSCSSFPFPGRLFPSRCAVYGCWRRNAESPRRSFKAEFGLMSLLRRIPCRAVAGSGIRGILRLHSRFAMRSSYSARDDNGTGGASGQSLVVGELADSSLVFAVGARLRTARNDNSMEIASARQNLALAQRSQCGF